MIERLTEVIDDGDDIVRLGAGLLRLCRTELRELQELDADPSFWSQRDELHRRCEAFFHEVDDEELDSEERNDLGELAASYSQKLPLVLIAHTIAEALDRALGSRILPMFLDREVTLAPGDPIPVPHPDWRRRAVMGSPGPEGYPPGDDGDDDADGPGDGLASDDDGPLDALPHLCLAGAWARDVAVTLDGDWRRWHTLPQLEGGDRLACATPNRDLAELAADRAANGDAAMFCNARFGASSAEQCDRVLSLLTLAHDHQCRVVALPELSVPEDIRPAIARWLADQGTVDLVVAGSCHLPGDNGDSGQHNEGVLLIRGIDRPMTHRKFAPGLLPELGGGTPGQPLREHLVAARPAFTGYLSTHWTVILLVGADATHPRIAPAITGMGGNLVLVPALAFELDGFRALASRVARRTRGVTVIANAGVAPAPGEARTPVIIGLPQHMGKVIAQDCPPRSLLIATIGSLTGKPSIVELDDEA